MPLLENFNKPVVLVSPLDWGLGHATRCIPIIHELITLKCRVIIASSGAQKAVLQEEFKDVLFIDLPGYNISYSSSGWSTKMKLVLQVPKIKAAIRKENRWLKKAIHEYNIDVVVSDNRYGLYSKEIPCIFITHQLLIKTSFGSVTDKLIQRINYRYISKFQYCWVPDSEGDANLAGALSHPAILPPVILKYIGPLSRFSPDGRADVSKHLMIILSGPEPQRTILEQQLLKELVSYQQPVILLRGLPGQKSVPSNKNAYIRIYNHLNTREFLELVLQAKIIISRAGYSSIMDLIPLGKTCVFIPTPGQPEQVYLAAYLSSKRRCLSYTQKNFSIEKMEKDLISFRQEYVHTLTGAYRSVIKESFGNLLAGD